MQDPLSVAIAQAIDTALEARLPKIVEALRDALPPLPRTPEKYRFHPLVDMLEAKTFGRADRSTIIRRSRRGTYPPLRKHGGQLGYTDADLDVIFSK